MELKNFQSTIESQLKRAIDIELQRVANTYLELATKNMEESLARIVSSVSLNIMKHVEYYDNSTRFRIDISIADVKEAAQGIAKSSAQQTEGRLFPAEQNKNSGLPEFDQNPPGGGLRPS